MLAAVVGRRAFGLCVCGSARASTFSSKCPSSYPSPQAELTPSFTNRLEFISAHETIPTYRVMDPDGNVTSPNEVHIGKDRLLHIYSDMIRLQSMDEIFYEAQRQGRLSFYMTAIGEEATHFGTAEALQPTDEVYSQYRESGVLMHRGWSLDDFANQCFSNRLDTGKGRQMPCHYGDARRHFHTISSPLATQIPQAAGTGFALRKEGRGRICACFFGDGAASEGDFFAGINMASTLNAHTLFFCRNNGWAISTPTHEQYRGDGIAARGPALGIPTIRVDGNDIFAIHNAVTKARELIVQQNRPVLLEAITYRIGHHSTSDDSTRYRPPGEIEYWITQASPVRRLFKYLVHKKWWNEERDGALKEQVQKDVLQALEKAGEVPKPPISDLFSDVYDQPTKELRRQEAELHEHLAKYGDKYNLGQYSH